MILVAAGRSTRFADSFAVDSIHSDSIHSDSSVDSLSTKKTFAILNGKPVWQYSAELFRQRNDVVQLIVVVAPDDEEVFLSRYSGPVSTLKVDVVAGGLERSDSVEKGLDRVCPEADLVVVHDAARPCIDSDLVARVITAATESGAAIPALAVHSTLKRSTDGRVIDETVDRRDLYLAQTPQVFAHGLLKELFAKRDQALPINATGNTGVTDEAQLAERLGTDVVIVAGSPLNIKITTKEDLAFANAVCSSRCL